MSTEKAAIKTEIDKARAIFERHISVKGLDFEWDGKRYTTANIQTKWLYFSLGYFAKQQEEA